jgi:ADP-dependent NAD(P)H-hydrate dehydratase / NAD(P)H-hydrate epimerase
VGNRARPAALPVREFRRLDLNAAELGVPLSTLMARAGKALASVVQARMGKGMALFVCGKGNNGGDGLAAAYLLERAGRDARVVLAEPRDRIATQAARVYLDLLPKGRVAEWDGRAGAWWGEARVLVDCLLGSGLAGPPRPPYDRLVDAVNRRRRRAHVVSCDVPSGLGTAVAVRPHETVTFHAAKEGMNPRNAGRIHVAPIGIPRAAETDVGLGDLAVTYPVPRPDSHKGDNGVVLVVSGGPYTGAPHYCGMSAYRTGADLVYACMPEEAARIVQGYGPHIMVQAVEPGTRLTPLGVPGILPWLDKATALLVGPGLGTDSGTREAVRQLLAEAARRGLPTVVDADGLDALTPELLQRHGHRMVLTPHSKEFLDLAGVAPTEASVAAYAARNGNVTVLWKRQGAFISDGQRRRWCRRGHPTMTVGGTGDVLAGAVAAILAKGATPFDAACAGAYLSGSAGELAGALRSWGATATDVLEAIPAVLVRLDAA